MKNLPVTRSATTRLHHYHMLSGPVRAMGAPMEDACFQRGDRVRATRHSLYIRAGMVGTVLAVAEPTKIVCLVQFDRRSRIEPVPVDYLERVESQSPPERRGHLGAEV